VKGDRSRNGVATTLSLEEIADRVDDALEVHEAIRGS